MTYATFQGLLSSFINRTDLTSQQIDYFVNTALREFEMIQPLNFTKQVATLTYPSTAGVGIPLDGNVLLPNYRSIAGDYAVTFIDPNGATVPIKGDTFANVQRRMRWWNPPNSLDWPFVNQALLPISQQTVVFYTQTINGVNTLFLYPEIADATLQVNFYSWIPEYDLIGAPNVSDWMLNYGNQVILWGALMVANRFLDDEAKIAIDNQQYMKEVDSVLRRDSTFEIQGSALDLD